MCYTVTRHLREFLRQEYINKYTEVYCPPEFVMEMIKDNFNVEERENLRPMDIRVLLKSRGLSKYYEYIPYILCKLKNKSLSLLILTEEQIDEITKLYQELSEKVLYEMRKNTPYISIGLPFIIQKLMGLLDIDINEYNEYNSRYIYRSSYKLEKYNDFWKRACQIMDWPVNSSFTERKIQVATKIQSFWRRRLAGREYQRRLIGREIELLPGIGISYQKAKEDFYKKIERNYL